MFSVRVIPPEVTLTEPRAKFCAITDKSLIDYPLYDPFNLNLLCSASCMATVFVES